MRPKFQIRVSSPDLSGRQSASSQRSMVWGGGHGGILPDSRQRPEIPPSCDGHHSGASQGELIHTQNQAHLTGGLK